MKSFLNIFVLICVLFVNVSFNVNAYDLGGVTPEVFDGWTDVEIANWFDLNFERHTWFMNGFINAPSAEDAIRAKFRYQVDIAKAGTETYEEWIARNCDVEYDDNKQVQYLFSDELSDALYLACMKYIEEDCGWYEVETVDYKQYPSNIFSSQGIYESFIGYCTQNIKGTDNILVPGSQSSTTVYNEDGSFSHIALRMSISSALENVEFYLKTYDEFSGDITAYMTQDWNTIMPNFGYLYDDGSTDFENPSVGVVQEVKFLTSDWYKLRPLTDGVRRVRVYKTLEELKSYSVGQRPYFTTSKFQDYDVNGDNSCIISESELNGSSVYGDVVNNIITIEGSDGLTEDELMRIVEEILKRMHDDDDSSGGGGSASGNDSGSGSGLGGFLEGLGSVGDALLSILGKLLEYIGKAVELLSGTVVKIIDLIPSNITALISGLFPFIPKEWLTAIELSLVLSVIIGIVGIFKK